MLTSVMRRFRPQNDGRVARDSPVVFGFKRRRSGAATFGVFARPQRLPFRHSRRSDKGVVTLSGRVPADAGKSKAESVAQSIAVGQAVSNQIAVVPIGVESDAKAINSDLDKGIEKESGRCPH